MSYRRSIGRMIRNRRTFVLDGIRSPTTTLVVAVREIESDPMAATFNTTPSSFSVGMRLWKVACMRSRRRFSHCYHWQCCRCTIVSSSPWSCLISFSSKREKPSASPPWKLGMTPPNYHAALTAAATAFCSASDPAPAGSCHLSALLSHHPGETAALASRPCPAARAAEILIDLAQI